MGTWGVDGATAVGTGRGFFDFGGTLFLREDTGGGLWRRTGPGAWTRCQLAVGPVWGIGSGCVWDGRLWEVGTDSVVYYSTDGGASWTPDLDIAVTWGTAASAPGGLGADPDGDYLYLAHVDAAWCYFARRPRLGAWVNNVANARPIVMGANNSQGIVNWGSDLFHSFGTFGLKRWDGVAWQTDSLASLVYGFQIHAGTIYTVEISGANVIVHRWSERDQDWTAELTVASSDSYLSRGTDGRLWLGRGTGPNSYIHYRNDADATWVQRFVTNVAAGGATAATFFYNEYFFVERSAGGDNIYLYAPDFDVMGPSVGGGPGGLGFAPQAMDCNADGDFLFLAAYDSVTGDPLLLRVDLPLTPDSVGWDVFTGTGGDAINVKCPVEHGGQVVIAGRLSAPSQDSVQVSDDAGLSFTDIDPNWGDMAQPLLTRITSRVIAVALQALQTLVETLDGGVSWIVRGGTGFSPTAMDGLSDELVVGGPAGQVRYSPNRGTTLADIGAGWPAPDGVVAVEVV